MSGVTVSGVTVSGVTGVTVSGVTGVTAADYFSTSFQLIPLENFSLKQPVKLPMRSMGVLRSCDIILGDFSHSLLMFHAMFRM